MRVTTAIRVIGSPTILAKGCCSFNKMGHHKRVNADKGEGKALAYFAHRCGVYGVHSPERRKRLELSVSTTHAL